uniref:zinc finger MYM-type protein 1-like n=1 Tax=Ciona intestinalis TaxID=7719 RepID=UPI0002B8D49C|nr:zinc finger MYM-type protein 1-like [Ciona intestinalis]|eukprot:XP_004227401.1 zinc finger MYM-type protein 1-like [Ciona intestinalis]
MHQVLNFIEQHDPDLSVWLKSDKKYKWLSHRIPNEIISICSLAVAATPIKNIKVSKFFSIISDETSDVSRQEQISICLRHVDESFKVNESLIGLFGTTATDANTIVSIILQALKDHRLDIQDCRGQSYDGAANMRGKITGVQTQIRKINPLATFVYCSAHQLNLVVQEALSTHVDAVNALSVLGAVVNLLKGLLNVWLCLKTFISETKIHRLAP